MSAATATNASPILAGLSPRRLYLRRLRRWALRPPTLFALAVMVLFVVAALFAKYVTPYGANEPTNIYFGSPTWRHPLGTDNLSRDILSRTIHGARASLQIGVMSVVMGTVSGAAIGILTGYFRGWVDAIGQRFVDVMMSLPGLLMALVIMAALGASMFNASLAIAIAILPTSARVARSVTMTVAAMPYVEAAQSVGATRWRIVGRHVVPNVVSPLVVIASVQLGFAILAEASLSYVGLGISLGTPSWGNMLSGSTQLYSARAPWMAVAPGVALTLVVMATNLLGDALRDLFDPRTR